MRVHCNRDLKVSLLDPAPEASGTCTAYRPEQEDSIGRGFENRLAQSDPQRAVGCLHAVPVLTASLWSRAFNVGNAGIGVTSGSCKCCPSLLIVDITTGCPSRHLILHVTDFEGCVCP